MDGVEGVSRAVADLLHSQAIAKIADLQTRQGPCGPNGVDPTPRLVWWTPLSPAAVEVDDWPWLCVAPMRVMSTVRVGMRRNSDEYDVRYQMRVFVYARGDGYEETAAVRARNVLMVTELLLAHQAITATIRLDPTTLATSFSDMADTPDLGTVSAAYCEFQVVAKETVPPALPSTGTADTSHVDDTPLP